MKLSDILYRIKCYFNPYNVVELSHLPCTWCDRDMLMFHAMFQILVDFVELEHPFTHDFSMKKRFTDRKVMREKIEYSKTPKYIEENYFYSNITEMGKGIATAEALTRAMRDEEILNLYEWYVDKKYMFEHNPCESVEQMLALGNSHDEECNRMLHRILAIRQYLWT